MVDLIERIDVLLRQEDTVYATVDYLESGYQLMLEGSSTPPPVLGSSFSVGPSTNSSSKDIDEFWREKIVEWMYQVIDHFDFSREIVSIAVSYLDRFLATRHVTKQLFQLISITTLYLAIKLYEGKRIHMYTMTRLSRGFFTVEDLQLMELEVLRGLSWNVHPPTAYCFAKHILALVPKTAVSMTTRQDILELARFLTELCVVDYYFVAKKPSSVALASMVVAMQEIPGSEAVERDFAEYLEKVPGLRLDSPEVLECMERLHLLYSQGGYATSATTATTETREETVSPVCVSYGLPPTQQLASPSAQPSSKVYIHLSAASSTAQFHAVRQGPYGSS